MNAKKAAAIFVLLPITAGNAFAEDTPSLNIESLSGQTVEVNCQNNTASDSNLVCVLYDSDTPVEVQIKNAENGKSSIQFEYNINDYDLKLFLWDDNMTALTAPCIREALNSQFTGGYNKITDGTSTIYSVTDSGSNPMTLFFNNNSDDITVSFDIRSETIPAAGSIIGMIPFSNDIRGCGAGLGHDGNIYVPTSTLPDIVFPFELEHTEVFAEWVNISLHFRSNVCDAVYSNPSSGDVYVNHTIPNIRGVGTETHPINKLVFGLAYTENSSLPAENVSFLIRNINIDRT